jgi:hypothetical protein
MADSPVHDALLMNTKMLARNIPRFIQRDRRQTATAEGSSMKAVVSGKKIAKIFLAGRKSDIARRPMAFWALLDADWTLLDADRALAPRRLGLAELAGPAPRRAGRPARWSVS